MRGGKRDGAGRKGIGPCKSYWLPIELEGKIKKLVDEYRAELDKKPEEKATFEKQKESISPIKPENQMLNDEQLKRFQNWLIKYKFAKSKTQARKMTETPQKCHETFLEYIHLPSDSELMGIQDIMELYAID